MSIEIIKRFIINMYARKMTIKEIATTVNKTEAEVRSVIEENEKEIVRIRAQIDNEENARPEQRKEKDKENKKPEKQLEEELPNFQEEKIVSKTLKKLLEIKRKVMLGEEYDKEALKKIRNRIIIKNYCKPNNDEIEELAQIYVQLGKFTTAKAIVKEIYDGMINKTNSDKIMSRIEKQELSYNVMKYYKKGMSAAQIAEELGLYTVDTIREINKQKELNNEIKRMHQEGKSEVDIAELFHENIDRVKWGIELKDKEQDMSKKSGDER